ncbi:MAG: hypothetical protein E3J35_08295 [Methanomassiliicoccales archaeon]|nr:MAG: hypothetical protein E3J35_08295 [Methanomassiliicoccales archaeon]
MASSTIDEARAWFSKNWTTLSILIGIFAVAMFLRTYFGYALATDPAFLVSGGSDSYYHKRIIDYVVENGKHLVHDPLLGYPIGLRAGRPPLYDWSVAVIGIVFSPLAPSVDVSVWLSFLFSTAVWGSLTIFPLFFLTKEAFGRRAGMAAAFLLAIMPAHIQRSPFSNADHDAYALFFAVTAFFFFLRALQLLEDKKWVTRWKKWGSIKGGLRDFFANNKKSVLYSMMSAFSIAAIALAWKGFAYIIIIILVYFGFQLLVGRLRNKDPMGILICFTITVGVALLVSFPWYHSYGFVRTWFDAPMILFLAAVALGAIFTFTRDLPWALVIPAVFVTFGISFAILAIINPAVAQSFISGAGYFVRTKTYETIAEAQAPNFSQMALAFGAVSFYLSLAALAYFFIQIPKRLEPFYLFLVIWSGASIFMALSAARFMFNAAPAIAMTAGWALIIIVDKLDFRSIKKSYDERRGNKLYAIRKSIKLRHVVGALFITGLILLPNIWYGVDAGMPFEEKRKYDQAIADMLPDFLEPAGLVEGRNFFLGAFGYSLPLKTRYWPAAWDWLAEQDADTLPVADRPAFLSWWDYGFEAVNAGKHPTVADNFLNGYQLAGNFIMAQGENDAIALLISRLIEGDYITNGGSKRLSDGVRDIITRYGMEYEKVEDILKNPGNYIPAILADPDKYSPRDSQMDIQNAMYIALRVHFISHLDVNKMADFYHDIRQVTGKSILYFAIDSRLFPFSGQQTGIFYAPAKLSDHRMVQNQPIDFFKLVAETNMGEFAPHEVPIGATTSNVRIEYQDMFWKSMLYEAFVGYSGEDLGKDNVWIPGLSGEYEQYQPIQSWNMTHFRVAYRTAYFNPYPQNELANHTEAWTAINFEDAIDIQQKINAGEMEGVVDASARSTLYNGVVILKYYDGAYVNGTVLVDGVSPLSGAWITIRDELQTVHYLTRTDSEGRYSALAPWGEIELQVSVGKLQDLTNLGATELDIVKFNVTEDQAMRRNIDADRDGILDYIITKDIDVSGGSLTGTVYLDRNYNTVYDEDEIVFPNAQLTFNHTDVDEIWQVTTDENGSYNLEGAFPGDYEVTLETEERLIGLEAQTVERDEVLERDINVTATSITGTVRTHKGESAQNASVQLYDSTNDTTITSNSDSNGSFALENLLSGEMTLEIKTGDESSLPMRVVLSMGKNETLNITLVPTGTVSGRTVVGAKIAPYTLIEFKSQSLDPKDRLVYSDGSGRFSVSLKEGIYNVYSVYDSDGQRSAYVGSRYVKQGKDTPLDILMTPSAVLSGTALSRGQPLARVRVYFEGESGTFNAETNKYGEYSAVLPIGSYKISAFSEGEVYASLVVLNVNMEHEITLEEAEKMAGFVYYDMDDSGERDVEEGLADVVLSYTDEEGRTLVFLTGFEGAYQAQLLPDGEYSLLVSARGFEDVSRPLSPIEDLREELNFSVTPKNITVSGTLILDEMPLIEDNVDIEFRSISNGSISTRTRSSNGAYSVNLRPGGYRVVIDQNISLSGDLRYQNRTVDEIQLIIDQDDLAHDLDVVKRGLVQGTVELEGEAASALVDIVGPDVLTLNVSDGEFEVFLALGEYTASSTEEFDGDEYSFIEGFQVAGGTILDLQFEESTRVTGLLRYKGSIVRESLDITFQRTVGGSVTFRTESSGRYEGHLLWGDYVVHVDHSTTESEAGTTRYVRYTHDSNLHIDQGESTVVFDIQIEKTFENSTISGWVSIGGVGTSVQVQFIARSLSAQNVTVYSDSTGNYSVEVMPGDYTIYVHRMLGHYTFLGETTIAPYSENEYDIPLLAGHRVSGVVTFRDNERQVSDVKFTANGSVELKTDELGRYELYLPPGGYLVEASTSVEEKGAGVMYEASKTVLIEDVSAVNLQLTKTLKRLVSVEWDSGQKEEIAQGQSVVYTITVTNEGNVEDAFTLEGTGPSDDWEYTFTPSKVVLDYGTVGDTASVQVRINTPANASVDHGPLHAVVRSENSSATTDSVVLQVDIEKIRGMDLVLTTLPATYDGTHIVYEIELKNLGNSKEEFYLSIVNGDELSSDGWMADMQDPVRKTYSDTLEAVEVDGNSTLKMTLRFTIVGTAPSSRAIILCYENDDRTVDDILGVPAFLPTFSLEVPNIVVSGRDMSLTEEVDAYLYVIVALGLVLLLMIAYRVLRGRRERRGR